MEADRVWIPYCGAAPTPAEWLWRWNLDPWPVGALLVATAAWYVLGRSSRGVPLVAALGLCVFLFISPFCALTSALFSARVAHHVILAAAVAPLLVAAFPRGHGRARALPWWTALHALVFWFWHAPQAYAWALSSDAIYWTMQASLLGSAVTFWSAIRRAHVTAAVVALLATTVQMGLLGALITFARSPLYVPHLATTDPWSLSALDDQQLAGLIMWAPAAGFYIVAAILLTARWLADEQRRDDMASAL
ncbi:MAG: cytochrome c oxidase assembly protein [Pseudomonadota bacterium]